MLAHDVPQRFDCADLVRLFNDTFLGAYNTRLVSGGDEPLYSPADGIQPATIVFAHDYFSSGLHEIAHWLIAGEHRRLQQDYGYWYCPDGRDALQQAAFEQVEIAPQALEWILTKACGRAFRLSLDNLTGDVGDVRPFAEAVYRRVLMYVKQGLSVRADAMRQALVGFYSTHLELQAHDFTIEEIYRP